jgi:hypothetical protein
VVACSPAAEERLSDKRCRIAATGASIRNSLHREFFATQHALFPEIDISMLLTQDAFTNWGKMHTGCRCKFTRGAMKKAFFILGILLLFFSSFVWVSSAGGLFRMTGGEFATLFFLSVVMMAPEILYQARRFFHSGSEDVPF